MCNLGVGIVFEETFSPGDKNRHHGSYCFPLNLRNIYEFINPVRLSAGRCVRAGVPQRSTRQDDYKHHLQQISKHHQLFSYVVSYWLFLLTINFSAKIEILNKIIIQISFLPNAKNIWTMVNIIWIKIVRNKNNRHIHINLFFLQNKKNQADILKKYTCIFSIPSKI